MESLNIIILLGIFISSIVNLAIELDDTHTIKHELQYRVLFCSIAIGTIYPILHSNTNSILLYFSILTCLVYRIFYRLKQLKPNYKKQ